MNNICPRLLVISHNILEESNNVGKTLLSFLTCWPKEQLYSIYFRDEEPRTYRCNSYYMLDDKSVLKEFCNKNIVSGKVISSVSKKQEITEDYSSHMENISYSLGNKRIPLVSYLRDRVWLQGKWKNQQFKEWILQVNPDVIFFIPNDYELAFHVLKYVKNVVSVPVITYYTDDAFYFRQKCFGIDAIRRQNLRTLGKYVADISECIFTTCTKMSEEYKMYFPSDYYEIGNSIEVSQNDDSAVTHNKSNEYRFSYIGNLHSNRWKNILDIGKAMEILRKQNVNIKLHVFSASILSPRVMKKIIACDGIEWEGKIGSEEVNQEQRKANVLVHTEAFDNKSKKSTRLSVSTKIFEYLNSGNVILGYGPRDVASMDFLQRIDTSVLCYERDELINSLTYIMTDYDGLCKKALSGKKYAEEHFDKDVISQKFFEIVYDIWREKK